MKMVLGVPSRGRPESIRRLAGAMEATCQGDTSLLVGLDDDDPRLADYLAASREQGWTAVVRSGLRQVVAWVNELFIPLTDGSYDYFGHIGDDNVPSTLGWDVRLMEALDHQPFAFGNDLYPSRPPGSLSCHIFMRPEVVKKLGYFGPPGIRHMYVDVAWYAWGVACGISFLPGVIIEHLHYTTGKSPMDSSNQASLECTSHDLSAWHAYCRSGQLNADIRKLGGAEFTAERIAQFNRELNIPG